MYHTIDRVLDCGEVVWFDVAPSVWTTVQLDPTTVDLERGEKNRVVAVNFVFERPSYTLETGKTFYLDDFRLGILE